MGTPEARSHLCVCQVSFLMTFAMGRVPHAGSWQEWQVKVKLLSRVRLLATPWTADYQAPLPTGFSRPEYWSGLPRQTLLLLLSCCSHVRLCVTPQTAAHRVLPFLGFSRPEHWSGLPFPSPKQTLTDIKGEIDSNTIIGADFNTPLTPMDRSSKQNINKETQVLNDTLDEMDLTDIFRTFHPNTVEYTFSSAHGTFSRIDHILGHKSNLSKFKTVEIISSIFSDHSAMRLDINYKKKSCKKHKHMQIKQNVSK